MPKMGKTEKTLIFFIIRVLISNLIGFFIVNSAVSCITNNIDLSNEFYALLSVTEVALCAVVNSIITAIGIKNNLRLFTLISQIPIFVLCAVNFLSDNYSFLIFVIKIVLIILVSIILSYLLEKKKRKIKVK